MPMPSQSPLPRYGGAVALVGLALLLTELVAWLILPATETPVVLFAVAVVLAAWQGGLGPGLVASALAALGVPSCRTALPHSFGLDALVCLGMYGFAAVIAADVAE